MAQAISLPHSDKTSDARRCKIRGMGPLQDLQLRIGLTPEDFVKYLVVLIIVLLSSTLLFSEQLPKKISKRASEL
jgi:hypothetical protein